MLDHEQRETQRIPIAVEAKYREKDNAFKPYHRAELLDIHHQGCRVLGGASLKRGDIVSVLVELYPEGPLHFEGVAAWSTPVCENRVFETGVRFLTGDPVAEQTYLKLFHYCLLNMSRS